MRQAARQGSTLTGDHTQSQNRCHVCGTQESAAVILRACDDCEQPTCPGDLMLIPVAMGGEFAVCRKCDPDAFKAKNRLELEKLNGGAK